MSAQEIDGGCGITLTALSFHYNLPLPDPSPEFFFLNTQNFPQFVSCNRFGPAQTLPEP